MSKYKEKKILLGFHDGFLLENLADICELEGYRAVRVSTEEELIEELSNAEYSRVMMDANLGHPKTDSVDAAVDIYEAVQQINNEGLDTKFLAISGVPWPVKSLKEKGIPAENKIDVKLWLKFLR
ncbi:hypothetical protein GOV08_05505 [Candidatus Woesearchaeota archaeon]|nr:hypothetical protein [Candidatus Woesearchaeota archaeon]